MIAIFHFYGRSTPREHFPAGGVIVEFFVLVSGVFFYNKWEREKQKQETVPDTYIHAYMKRRFIRFFPYNLGGVIFAFLVERIYLYQVAKGGTITVGKLARWFSTDIWEILLIKMNGLNKNTTLLNGPAWTISAMFISELVVLCWLVYKEKQFYTVVCPISILIGYGFWAHLQDVSNEAWIGFTTFGVLRVFLIMCLAWYCYQLALLIKRTKFTKKGVWILTLCEGMAYSAVIVIIMYGESRNFKWCATLLLIFAVALSMSQKTYLYAFCTKLNYSFTSWLGRISLGIYLTHETIIGLYTYFYPNKYDMYREKVAYMIVCLITAIVFDCLVLLGEKGCKKAFDFLKGKMLERN